MLIGDVWLTRQTADEVAALTGTHRKTVLKWMRDKHLPKAVEALLDTVQNGNLGRLSETWRGWRIHPKSGELCSPEGFSVGPGEIRALTYRYHYISSLEQKIRALKAERDSLLADAALDDFQRDALSSIRVKTSKAVKCA